MEQTQCSSCYFSAVCSDSEICGYYYPIDEEAISISIDTAIEENRVKFREEWYVYLEDAVIFSDSHV